MGSSCALSWIGPFANKIRNGHWMEVAEPLHVTINHFIELLISISQGPMVTLFVSSTVTVLWWKTSTTRTTTTTLVGYVSERKMLVERRSTDCSSYTSSPFSSSIALKSFIHSVIHSVVRWFVRPVWKIGRQHVTIDVTTNCNYS